MTATTKPFVPALGFHWLTPLYDVGAWMVGERRFKERLVAQAVLESGLDVLDVGCGTGTLAIMAKQAAPGARVVGVDLDPHVLAMARAKIAAAGVEVALVESSATALALSDASFDRVLTTLMLHHLTDDEKRAALAGMCRVLRPGGSLHVADFGRPAGWLQEVASSVVRWFDGAERLATNLAGRLPALVAAAGFTQVEETATWPTVFGTVVSLRATRPAAI